MVTTVSVAQIGALVGDPARVAMLQALMDGRALTASELAQAAGVTPQTATLVTPEGLQGLAALGIDTQTGVAGGRRAKPLCRPCLDWSERRPHLAGRLGIALCTHSLQQGWIRKQASSRALDITPVGWRALHDLFDIRRPFAST